MMFEDKTVLVLSPHTDDAEIGCGGTIARMVEEGARVYCVAFSNAVKSLPDRYFGQEEVLRNEFNNSLDCLGVKQKRRFLYNFETREFFKDRQEILDLLVQYRMERKPDIVFVPCSYDYHQDHLVIYTEAFRAFKNTTMLGYEIPGNTRDFTASCFVKLQPIRVAKKLEAIKCYKSQLVKCPEYFLTSITGQMTLRGQYVKTEYAEAFELVRLVC